MSTIVTQMADSGHGGNNKNKLYQNAMQDTLNYASTVINQLAGTSKTGISLASTNYYVPWYHIKLGKAGTAYYWEIISDKEANNPIVQVEHKKNGSGLCNSFTIVLACRLTSSYTKIDKILPYIGLKADFSGFELQYGYGPPHNIHSPLYNGILTSYSIEAQNGLLIYTLIGYSSIVKANSEMIELLGAEDPTNSGFNKKPTEIVEKLINEYASKHSDPSDFNYFDYEFVDIGGVVGTDNEIEIFSSLSMVTSPVNTLAGWIDWLLSIASYSGDTNETKTEDRSIYTYLVLDKKSTGTNKNLIMLRRYSASDTESQISLEFEWGNVSSGKFNLVHEFRPQFNGEVAMAMMSNSQDSSSHEVYKIEETGDVVFDTDLSEQQGSSNAEETKAVDEYTWTQMIQENVYKAQLVTAGIPADIPILTKIKITPFIGGVKHELTAGIYWVLSSVDRIDDSGFVTTLELFKTNLQAEYTRKIPKPKKVVSRGTIVSPFTVSMDHVNMDQ